MIDKKDTSTNSKKVITTMLKDQISYYAKDKTNNYDAN
jgi:hypothetical protein